MAVVRECWTFPVGEGNLAVASSHWEGLLFLNSTAAWVWQNQELVTLVNAYQEHFGLSYSGARSDIDALLARWRSIGPPIPAVLDLIFPTTVAYHSASFCVNQTEFLVRFETKDFMCELMPRLAALQTGESTPRYTFDLVEKTTSFSLFLNGVHLATEPLITGVRAILLQEMARLAEADRDYVAILHAGAVGGTNGCVILGGASFSGKSTLCAGLMQAGLICYSDDSVCLTPDFQVVGMPFAISLREGAWPLFPHLDHPRFLPSNLNGTSPTVPPFGFVFVNYDPAAESTTLEPLETFEALVALQQSGFWVEHTEPAIKAFIDWLAGLPIKRLRYSNFDSAIAEVKALLAQP